jgi:hypothetical protein
METLKESIIEKLDNPPEATLREVMEYVTFLAWRDAGAEPSLLCRLCVAIESNDGRGWAPRERRSRPPNQRQA